MKILILGATGMLGFSLFANLKEQSHLEVFGTVRNVQGIKRFFAEYYDSLIFDVDVSEISLVEQAISKVNPDVVINCVGLIKQNSVSTQYINAIEINSLLPHQLANICDLIGAKLIHFSTDCVFTGQAGGYIENDHPDARDLYGKSKCLGEVDYGKHLTLRTSIIGHELTSSVSLVDWFLSQSGEVSGYSKAIFSGLPTCYIAKLLVDKILPAVDLSGLYHLSVEPIDKYTLLNFIAETYGKDIAIRESGEVVIDRSLNSEILRQKVNFAPPRWTDLVEYMHGDYLKRYSS